MSVLQEGDQIRMTVMYMCDLCGHVMFLGSPHVKDKSGRHYCDDCSEKLRKQFNIKLDPLPQGELGAPPETES